MFIGRKNPFYGKTHSSDFSKAQSFRMKKNNPQQSGKLNSFYGSKHSAEFKQFMSNRMSGKSNLNFGKRKAHCVNGHLRTFETVYKSNYACKICVSNRG